MFGFGLWEYTADILRGLREPAWKSLPQNMSEIADEASEPQTLREALTCVMAYLEDDLRYVPEAISHNTQQAMRIISQHLEHARLPGDIE